MSLYGTSDKKRKTEWDGFRILTDSVSYKHQSRSFDIRFSSILWSCLWKTKRLKEGMNRQLGIFYWSLWLQIVCYILYLMLLSLQSHYCSSTPNVAHTAYAFSHISPCILMGCPTHDKWSKEAIIFRFEYFFDFFVTTQLPKISGALSKALHLKCSVFFFVLRERAQRLTCYASVNAGFSIHNTLCQQNIL